jgi:hypothetical protein
MDKVTQLAFGALSPGNVNVNLMSANITAGAATSPADLLTDLKSGYLARIPVSSFLPSSPASLSARSSACSRLQSLCQTRRLSVLTSSQRLPPRPGPLLRSRSVVV